MKDKKITIALVANIGAGKSFVAYHIQEKYKANIIKLSGKLLEIINILHLEPKRENFANLSLSLRKMFGENILGNATFESIKDLNSEIILIDGVRRLEDIENIKKLNNFYLVFIDTSLETRSLRMKKRQEKSDDLNTNITTLSCDERHDSENRVTELKEKADFIIDNNDSIEKLKENIDNMMKKLLK